MARAAPESITFAARSTPVFNPGAMPAQLKEQVINIAVDTWNKYFAPVLGVSDSPILAIYSLRFTQPPFKDAGYPFFINAMNVIGSVILWPVLEEIFYRGLLFEHLKRNLGVILAILITSAFFMVQHVPHQGWVMHHFYFSIVACLAFLIFKNLMFPITIHTALNTYYVIGEMPNMTHFAIFSAMGFLIVLMIIGINRGKHPYDIEDRMVPGWGKAT